MRLLATGVWVSDALIVVTGRESRAMTTRSVVPGATP